MVKADLVSGILPVREDGRCLLVLRPSGTWDPPAGRLAPGESFEAGAVREVYEETGLLVTPQRIIATWVGERPSNGEPLASVTYIGRAADSGVRLSEEHLDYRWATAEEWLELPSWWGQKDILRAARLAGRLPPEPPEPPPLPNVPAKGIAEANLGAGTVLVDDRRRALLMRRRKPPVGLWENPGGMLEPGESFEDCARREVLEETGIDAEPEAAWWTKLEPWRSPDDPELYAGVGFISRCAGGEVRLESAAHDAYRWATEEEWQTLRTWYTPQELDVLWSVADEL
jgi:8-oxo-dGTP diphosphatase